MTYPAPFTGNATSDAEIRTSQSGVTVASFTLAVTPREKQPDGTYGDGQAAFYRVACFKQLADNVAESVKRGDRVTVVGTLKPREYEHQGEKRTSLDLVADEVALSLRFATATATKAQRQTNTGQSWTQQPPAQGQGGQGQWDGGQQGGQQSSDPWASGGQQAFGGGGMPANVHDSEPPFAP